MNAPLSKRSDMDRRGFVRSCALAGPPVAMATAARSHAPEMGVVTVEMKTSFMQPAQGPLVARGRLLHRTATLAFTEATVHDAQGRLCCQATGTFKVVRRLPVDGRQVHVLKAVPTD